MPLTARHRCSTALLTSTSRSQLDHLLADVESRRLPGLLMTLQQRLRSAKVLRLPQAKTRRCRSIVRSIPDRCDQLAPRESLTVVAGSTSGSFNLGLGWRSSNEADRVPACVNQFNRSFASPDLRGNVFCNGDFCHDRILSPDYSTSTRARLRLTHGEHSLEQPRDSVMRYRQPIRCDLLNLIVRIQRHRGLEAAERRSTRSPIGN